MADGDPARIGHEAMVVMHLPPSAESPTNADVSRTTYATARLVVKV